MVENWIRVNEYKHNCKISFRNVDIILEDKDVEYLVNELQKYQISKAYGLGGELERIIL